VAMSGITGNFERALRESSRVLAVRGQILPSTVENVTLCAELDDASFVEGESKLPHGPAPIRRAYLRPSDAAAFPEALKAIAEADLIILGPGSLYTSIMPNLLVTGIAAAIRQAKCNKIYVCNVASQPGETGGYNLSKHVESLESHVGKGLFSYVVANDHLVALPEQWQVHAIDIDAASLNRAGLRVIAADVIDTERPTRHDPTKLAAAIMDAFWRNHGPSSPAQDRLDNARSLLT
jgi:uncharacterized cofD-like protein